MNGKSVFPALNANMECFRRDGLGRNAAVIVAMDLEQFKQGGKQCRFQELFRRRGLF